MARILVVDDEPDLEALVLQRFRRQIRGGAYDFLFASDGNDALAKLEANPDVELVLSLPFQRLMGFELVRITRDGAESRLRLDARHATPAGTFKVGSASACNEKRRAISWGCVGSGMPSRVASMSWCTSGAFWKNSHARHY